MSHLNLNAGETIYKYSLIRELGSGCFGEVWLAYDATIDRTVAVKIIAASGPITIDRFKESRIGNHFDHANLVKVHYADIYNHNGQQLIVIAMDYLRHGSIQSAVNSMGFLPLPSAIQYMRNILFGLDHLHHLNFFHNDIKPNNILLGEAAQAVLTDYGVTCTPTDSGTNRVQSYLLHRAPETQNARTINALTDIYQCGLTAFRLFCGIGLLEDMHSSLGETSYIAALSSGNLIGDRNFPAFIPSKIKNIIRKSIALNPNDRYQTAMEMLRDFEQLSYPGYWTSDACNNLIGKKRNSSHEYSFEVIPSAKNEFNFIARVKYPSGTINTISKFSKNGISKSEKQKLQKAFFKDIIES